MLGEIKEGKLYVEGLEYIFPTKPLNKDIINYGVPKSKQKWVRLSEYESYDWTDGWEERIGKNEEQTQFLIDEVRRLDEGVWVYINGEVTYLNRYMYFFLQWFVLEDSGEYPEYRDTSLYYYRFIEICEKAKMCNGDTLLKGRRLGATSMVDAKILLKCITCMNKNFGIISKTGDDASAAFGFVTNAFQSLPPFIKPQIEGNESPKKVLSLKKQANRITKGQRVAGTKEGLNNKLLWKATNANSFDGGAYEEILIDESGKFPKDVPITKYLQVVTKCVKKGARITGYLSLPTTVNPPNSGGAEYQVVWENSNQDKADYLGQTKTGLYRIMIPAYAGFSGYIDAFGNSVITNPTPEQTKYLTETGDCPDPTIGSKDYLEHIRKTLEGDIEALQEEIRMNPFNAKEVFESANQRCLFNVAELTKREEELKEKLQEQGLNVTTGELGRRGWFFLLDNGRSKFVDDPKGLWYIHHLLSENESNKFQIVNGKQTPTNEEYGSAGLDSVFSGDAAVDKGSDACLMIHARYSSMDEENTGMPSAMFLGRMEDINKYHDQIFAGLIYYGVKMLAERAPVSWIEYANLKKLDNYLYGTKRSDGSEVKGVVAQSNTAMKDEHVEVQVLASLSCIHKIPFIRLIRDMQSFDVNNRTDYDCCMAWGYSLMAAKIPFKKIKKENTGVKFLRKGVVMTT